MRLAFVNRYFWPDHSATSQLLSDLAAELGSRGAVVTIFTSRQRYDDAAARLPDVELWRGIEIRRIWTTCFGRSSLPRRALDYLSFCISLPFALLRLRAGDIVIVMTDPPLASVFALPAARLRGAKLVNWIQDLFPEVAVALGSPRIPALVASFAQALRDRSLRGALANVAIGELMAERVRRRIPASADRVHAIANWPHEDAIRPMPAHASQLRRRLDLLERFVVGYSGNLGRAHDWQAILAVAQALRGDPHIVFLVGGGGAGYEALRDHVNREPPGNILFQPYHPMEYLSDSMAAADLHLVSLRPEMEGLVVPSKFYGIAAACRPIGFIGDPDGELGKLVRENDLGFALPATDPAAIADAIRRLAANPAMRETQGVRARQLLERRYSRSEAHRHWHQLLSDLDRTKVLR